MKEILNNIRRIDEEIDAKIEEAYHIRCLAEKVTSIITDERRGSGGISDKVGTAVAKLITLSDEINAQTDRFVELKAQAEAIISEVKNPDHRLVLRYRYFSRLTWEEIAVKMHYTYQWVHVIHGRALKEFEKAYNARALQ